MRDIDFERTRKVAELALGPPPDAVPEHVPGICFDLSSELAALGSSPIASRLQEIVAGQLRAAYAWCTERFPLRMRDADMNPVSAILEIHAAHSAHVGEYLTASSPHRPYRIFVAAPWPLPSIYRLGSLLAHEAMHQGLYNRERIACVARPGSLAYSPWKQRLRPGRLVWHAAWTFSTQFSLLCDAMLSEGDAMLAVDPDLLNFIAEMEARIVLCIESLETFEVLDPDETGRVAESLAETAFLAQAMVEHHGDYASLRSRWSERVSQEIDDWSAREFPRVKVA